MALRVGLIGLKLETFGFDWVCLCASSGVCGIWIWLGLEVEGLGWGVFFLERGKGLGATLILFFLLRRGASTS